MSGTDTKTNGFNSVSRLVTSRRDGLTRRLQQFLHVREVRQLVALLRYFWFAGVLRRMRTFELAKAEHLGVNTFGHNFAKVRKSVLQDNRILHMVRPVAAIERVSKKLPYQKVLSIGPRAEGELLLIAAHGFTWRNVRGLDLFSYSPNIDVGDMHDMPYPDSTFDVVFLGWALAYSDDQPRALAEIVRVAKSGAIIAIGTSHTRHATREDVIADRGHYLGGTERKNSIDDIVAPIATYVDTMYFRQEVSDTDRKADLGVIVAAFSIKK